MVHAIGDRANATAARHLRARRAARTARATDASASSTRSTCAPRDIPRFAQLGVIASMQPYHAIDDGRWAEQVIGPKRIETTYAFRSLLDAGATLAFGSDWFVAPPTPLEGIYAAVTRRTLDDKNPGGWVPEQKITVEEALRAYTAGGAYASFEESRKGTLAPGKLADFVMLDRDLFEIPPATDPRRPIRCSPSWAAGRCSRQAARFAHRGPHTAHRARPHRAPAEDAPRRTHGGAANSRQSRIASRVYAGASRLRSRARRSAR